MLGTLAATSLLLSGLCIEHALCASEGTPQKPLKGARERARILAICPAYEHYARFAQYGFYDFILQHCCATLC